MFNYLLPVMAVFVIGCSDPVKEDTLIIEPTPIVAVDPIPIKEPEPGPIAVIPVPVVEEPVPEPVIEEPVVPEPAPIVIPAPVPDPIIVVPDFDSTFIGRIIYENGDPYIDGLVQLEGENWKSYAPTDLNGSFEVPAFGDRRFDLSALSPWDEEERYIYFARPIIVEQYSISNGIICDDNITIAECIENEENHLQ